MLSNAKHSSSLSKLDRLNILIMEYSYIIEAVGVSSMLDFLILPVFLSFTPIPLCVSFSPSSLDNPVLY